ncbi:MAG: polyamine aminopropyltransferase [Deltaproteobacteria bacterium]|nr:polyamine aminopropyltransferase [Deltaproteobacteria bacterium]
MISFKERDPYAPINYHYEVESVLFRQKSAFQDIMVFTNPFFGRILVLDGVVQITERDEYMYHEMLTHPAMHAHPAPKTVVVVGGGDGGIVREVLKHDSVEAVHLVEIDAMVVETARRFFPQVAAGLEDPRVTIHAMDGAVFLAEADFHADVIIVDSTDIVGHAKSLFAQEFFRNVHNRLAAQGLYVSHTESIHFHLPMARQIHEVLRGIFPDVRVYTAPIATYAGNWWCFVVGAKGGLDPSTPSRWKGLDTVMYCPEMHTKAFLPDRLTAKLFSSAPWPR